MSGYVYLIGSHVFGWYKIGKSKTPEVRIKDLGILLPFKINVIGVWKAVNHTLMEQALHEIYKEHRINGEWFEFSKQKVQDVFQFIPRETCIYPVENVNHSFDQFSNLEEDTKQGKRVIRVKVEKLRGNFTQKERDTKRQEAIAEKRIKKAEREYYAEQQLQLEFAE